MGPSDRAILSPWVTQWLKGNLLPLLPCQFTAIFPGKWPSQRHRLGIKSLSSSPVLASFYICIALSLSFPYFLWFISPFTFVVFAFLQYLFSFFLVTFIHSSLLKETAVFFTEKYFPSALTQCHTMHCLLRKSDVTWFRCRLQFAHQLNSCVTLTSQNLFVQCFKVGYAGPGLLIIFTTASCCRKISVVEPAT